MGKYNRIYGRGVQKTHSHHKPVEKYCVVSRPKKVENGHRKTEKSVYKGDINTEKDTETWTGRIG